MKKIMIAWVNYQRRADCMKDYWGYDLRHLHTNFGKRRVTKPIDYFIKIIRTLWILIKERPDQIWVQLPPSLLLHLASIYKKIFNKNCVTIADLHNSMLRDRWINFPWALNLLKNMDIVLAHNADVKLELLELGLSEKNVFVLEDFPFRYKQTLIDKNNSRPYLIFPCSFDTDEPIATVLRAAASSPIDFYITGDTAKFVNNENLQIPENVYFTSYLSKNEYEILLLNATVVLGMTTRQNVQLSVANEGLSACKPLILSDTRTLRSLYSEAALFIDNDDPASLVEAINHAVAHTDSMSQLTKNLMQQRIERWHGQAKKIAVNKLSM